MAEKRKRRWLQFSLRSLLAFVLLVSIGMSWLGVKLERARKQGEAVEIIEKAGGDCTRFRKSPVPKWMRALFGDDFFDDFFVQGCYVYADETDFGDHEARYLKQLMNPATLWLSGTQITDAGLEHLRGLTNLGNLFLDDTQLPPEELRACAKLCLVAGAEICRLRTRMGMTSRFVTA